jgi:hypothetical protein
VFQAVLVVLALVCLIMCIFIMAKSSQYFSFLFGLTSESAGRTYLQSNYKGISP